MDKSGNDFSYQQSKDRIIEVFESNFIQEIKRLSCLLEEYNYIGMDTEFPGVVFKLDNYSTEFYYKSVKLNVDALKLIQLGITLCNSRGQKPPEGSTWQFNLRFNLSKDKYCNESISLLSSSGIKFDQLKHKGIPHKLFAEYLMVSGLVLNPNVHWISYHGSYDFSYLLKIVCNSPLPNTEREFMESVELYYPCLYDIKIMIQGKDQFKGGLNKLAQVLDINRTGEVHQAGSDSIITADTFFSLISNQIIPIDTIQNYKNIIYGIGEGEDNNETILYTLFNNDNRDTNRKASILYQSSIAQEQQNQYSEGLASSSSSSSSFGHSAYYPYMNYGKNMQTNSNTSGNGTYIFSMNNINLIPMPTSPISNLSQQNGTMHSYQNFVV